MISSANQKMPRSRERKVSSGRFAEDVHLSARTPGEGRRRRQRTPHHQSFDVIRTRVAEESRRPRWRFRGLYCAPKLDALSWRENGEQPKPIVTSIDANETFLFNRSYRNIDFDMEETGWRSSGELLQNTTVRFARKKPKIVPDTILTTKSGTEVSGTGGQDCEGADQRRETGSTTLSDSQGGFQWEKNFVKGARNLRYLSMD